jgi:hypothetical protein
MMMAFEELHLSLMALGALAGVKRAEVPPPPSFGIEREYRRYWPDLSLRIMMLIPLHGDNRHRLGGAIPSFHRLATSYQLGIFRPGHRPATAFETRTVWATAIGDDFKLHATRTALVDITNLGQALHGRNLVSRPFLLLMLFAHGSSP